MEIIFIWGMLGGLLRLGITDLINYHVFPLATLIINLIGACALLFWNNYLGKRLKLSSMVINSFGTEFIGSFTTFSGRTPIYNWSATGNRLDQNGHDDLFL